MTTGQRYNDSLHAVFDNQVKADRTIMTGNLLGPDVGLSGGTEENPSHAVGNRQLTNFRIVCVDQCNAIARQT